MLAKNFCLYSVGTAFLVLALLGLQMTGTNAHVDETLTRTETLVANEVERVADLTAAAVTMQNYQLVQDHVALRFLISEYAKLPGTVRHESRQFNFTAVSAVRLLNERLADTNDIASRAVRNTDYQMSGVVKSTQTIADVFAGIRRDAQPVFRSAGSITQQIDAQLPEYINCGPSDAHPTGNKHCLLLAYLDAVNSAKSFERSGARIAANTDRWVDRLTAPPCQQKNGFLRATCNVWGHSVGPLLEASRIIYYAK